MTLVKRPLALAAAVVAVAATVTGTVAAAPALVPGLDFSTDPPRAASPPPRPNQVIANLPPGQANPAIANGASVGRNVSSYFSSGTGPAARNTAAPAGSPERYLDPATLPGGALGDGITITEAQSINALERIQDNLASVGLRLRDVISMRVYLDNPPGEEGADYAGWNRAYRQFFANTDLTTNAPVDVPLGTGAPAAPRVVTATRPARTTIEVGSLPVSGWLVEIEVVAQFTGRR